MVMLVRQMGCEGSLLLARFALQHCVAFTAGHDVLVTHKPSCSETDRQLAGDRKQSRLEDIARALCKFLFENRFHVHRQTAGSTDETPEVFDQ